MRSHLHRSVGFVALVALCAAAAAWQRGFAAEPDATPGADQARLEIFVPDQKWKFTEGAEFPGAKGSFEVTTQSDQPAGALHYDFTDGGKYVSASTEVQMSKDAKQLRFKAKSDKTQSLLLRLTDSDGQVHQYKQHYTSVGEWQSFKVSLGQKSAEHWHGKADGVIRFPVEWLAFGVEGGKPKGVGTVFLSDVVLIK